MKILTIGHSNHTLDKFAHLLNENGVMILVDVRTAPYSRYNSQFNKDNLSGDLDSHNIQYYYAGKHLGGRPSNPDCYKSHTLPEQGADYLHEVDYPAVMRQQYFIKGIKELLKLADQDQVAIMCSEEDPAQCHRHHLIAKFLQKNHPEVDVRHIRADGSVYSASSVMTSIDDEQSTQLSLF